MLTQALRHVSLPFRLQSTLRSVRPEKHPTTLPSFFLAPVTFTCAKCLQVLLGNTIIASARCTTQIKSSNKLANAVPIDVINQAWLGLLAFYQGDHCHFKVKECSVAYYAYVSPPSLLQCGHKLNYSFNRRISVFVGDKTRYSLKKWAGWNSKMVNGYYENW